MVLSETFESAMRDLRRGQRAHRQLATAIKDQVLRDLAKDLISATDLILDANQKDLQALNAEATSAFRDRLTLTPARIQAMATSLNQVAGLPDPVGELLEEKVLENGLKLSRVRSPLGVILMIFESRPNVILEAFSLAYKSGNSIVLRGGSESRFTAAAIYKLMRARTSAFIGIEDYDRTIVNALLSRKDLIDIVVPRGGEKLIAFVQENARMPIIKNDRGLCHAYVDDEVDLEMAVRVVVNAKTQRPGVCNSLETVLVHEKVAARFLPSLFNAAPGVEWRADELSRRILPADARIKAASDRDWDTEHLDQILNCRVVADLDSAIAHIEAHGSGHSETILTASEVKARRFQSDIDAAAVYWNASTRFTDGFEFGLGGELGISTQKLHVRGPVGLRELTTPRWLIDGSGQIRA